MRVPGPFKISEQEYNLRLREFEDIFYKRQAKKLDDEIVKAGFSLDIGSQIGGHDPHHPACW